MSENEIMINDDTIHQESSRSVLEYIIICYLFRKLGKKLGVKWIKYLNLPDSIWQLSTDQKMPLAGPVLQ